jgi:DUF1680 family protein
MAEAESKQAQIDPEIIAVIAKAQREDGYLHTQTIFPQRQGGKVKEFADREHFVPGNQPVRAVFLASHRKRLWVLMFHAFL